MILYLIRHGYSLANQKKLVTGTPDDWLTTIGRTQALQLGDWLKTCNLSPDRQFVSHWGRARETAELIFAGAELIVDPRLGETDAGSVADLPLQDFLSNHPGFYDDPANRYPGGESHLELNHRVISWLDEQLESPCKSILAVTHSGPISCLLQHVMKINMTAFPAFLPMHATVSVIHFQYEASGWNGRLVGFSHGPQSVIQAMFNA